MARGLDDEARWLLLPEPAFMHPDFEIEIPGTTRTVLTPVLVKGDKATTLEKETYEQLGLNLDSIRRVARRSASSLLATLEPKVARDEQGVVAFAVLESESPGVAGTVLAPDFIDKFRDLLGPDLLVAIPNRFRVYVYPALASRFENTADLVLRDYELSAYPVSREVFRITPDGLEAVGAFQDR